MLNTSVTYFNSDGLVNTIEGNEHGKEHRLWVDVTDPTTKELEKLKKEYNLDDKTLKIIEQETKRPQIRMLDNYIFTILLDIKYKTLTQLLVSGVYVYLGKDWMITIHSSDIDLLTLLRNILEQKNKKLLESSIDALYFTLINELINKYEQLLTSIELTITGFEQKSLYKNTSKKMLEYLNIVTKQIILIRRHFWYTRDVINFLTHTQQDKEDIKYLQIVYDDINQLIDLIEPYRDTINSTRDLYIANVSLQLNDTMRILTIFSVILLPLTLITGIYGMNGFDLTNIDKVPSGFIFVVLTMVALGILLILYFKKKQWILNKDSELHNGL